MMIFFNASSLPFPRNFSEFQRFYIRSSIAVVTAYITQINPIGGALILLGHGAWELADQFLLTQINIQKLRLERYEQAFNQLVTEARTRGTLCTQVDIEQAKNIFFVHNLIEEVCYQALAEIIIQLDIQSDTITADQSGKILAYVKDAAHVELRKEGGYVKKGREIISPTQFEGVMRNVATIIHDRDVRLTDARYYSLIDLCVAIDDHNHYVKNVLLRSWLRCENLSSDAHLDLIKNMVHFNQKMMEHLGGDFKKAVEERKHYYDKFHGDIRQAQSVITGQKFAAQFVKVSEVRAQFKRHLEAIRLFSTELSLIQSLIDSQIITVEESLQLTTIRRFTSLPKYGCSVQQPPLLNANITVGEFLETYFPETIKQEIVCSVVPTLGANE